MTAKTESKYKYHFYFSLLQNVSMKHFYDYNLLLRSQKIIILILKKNIRF